MRNLVAPTGAVSTSLAAYQPIQRAERKPRLTLRGRRARAASILAVAVLGTSLAAGKLMLNHQESVHEAAVVKALGDDKNTVEMTRKPDETDDMLIDRTYKDVPKGVRPALEDYLKLKEVNDKGKYVGPIALKGYDMPVAVEGLVLQENVAKLYAQQQADAQHVNS